MGLRTCISESCQMMEILLVQTSHSENHQDVCILLLSCLRWDNSEACGVHWPHQCLGYYNKLPQIGQLNNRNVFSHSSGAQNSKIRVSACTSLHIPQMVAFSLCPQVAFALYTCFPSTFCSPCNKTSLSELGSFLRTSFNLNYHSKGPISKCSHMGSGGFHTHLGGHKSVHNRGFQNSPGR